MARPVRILLQASSILFVTNFGLVAHAGVPVRTVAAAGQEADGTVPGGNGTFASVSDASIDENGRATFLAHFAGNGFDEGNSRGVYSEGNGTLFLWAQAGTEAPGAGAGVNFFDFGAPITNRDGKIAFSARLTGAGVVPEINDRGIWSNRLTVLQLVARAGDQAPGAPAGAKFRFALDPVFNSAGVAFRGLLTDVGAVPPAPSGIWTDRSGSLAPILVAGAQATGLPAGVRIADVGNPSMNGSGQTVFDVLLSGTGVNGANNQAVYFESNNILTLIARSGQQAPGTLPGVNFAGFSNRLMNDAGHCAFTGILTGFGVVQNVNDFGIWSNAGGSLNLVARTGSQAPDTPLGVAFDSFFAIDQFVMNAAGRVAFNAELRGAGVTPGVNGSGIWSQGGGNLALVARAGSQAPGLPAGVVFDVFNSQVAINDSGRVAFTAHIRGNGITTNVNDSGIWVETDSGLTLVARAGESIQVAPGDARSIQFAFIDGGAAQQDGHKSNFNNAGDVAYVAQFTDQSTGVFSTKLELPDRTCGTCGVGASASMAMAVPLLLAAKRVRRPGRERTRAGRKRV